ncbi:MAG: cell division protein FtsW [Candidatus Taylorbacteria bacterium]|nr:cell division protein FtsW [Candidatus Taylorbacteria bacterium]
MSLKSQPRAKGTYIDTPLLASILGLVIAGFLVFVSASLGLLARDTAQFGSVAMNQTISLILGLTLFWIMSRVNYRYVRKYAFYILVGALLSNLLLFIPALSLHHGGATRWLDFGFVTFQPSELLKIGFIIYVAAWLSMIKEKVTTLGSGIIPFCILLGILSVLLLIQSDTNTLAVVAFTGICMLYAAGAKLRHIAIIIFIGIAGIAMVAMLRPYAQQRIMTFLNPANDPQGAGYQIQQSLIAIGSGGMWGRGFGQSVQKFEYLPEPIGDSIFAVQAEEFGFIGSTVLVLLFVFFAVRSLKIASNTEDSFGGLFVIGLVILIITGSFINIGAMLGLVPLTGKPLLFVSHGGSALMIILASVGIIANISKHQKS